jgi:hypothetical protein
MMLEVGLYYNSAVKGAYYVAIQLPEDVGGFIIFHSGRPQLTAQQPAHGFKSTGQVEVPNLLILEAQKLFRLEKRIEPWLALLDNFAAVATEQVGQ